jgi:hypothetical protein
MNDEINVLKRTADVVTDRMAQIEIPVKKLSWFDKLLKRPEVRVFEVRRACFGAMINFSGRVLAIHNVGNPKTISLHDLIKAIGADGDTMIACLAILIEDTSREPRAATVNFLRDNIDNVDARAILAFLMSHSRYEDFLSSIILVKGMSLMEPEEMIAPEKIFGQPLGEQ